MRPLPSSKLFCAISRMQGATSAFAGTPIASDNVSNFERMDAAMLASSRIAFKNVANFERTDAARFVFSSWIRKEVDE